MHIKVRTEKNGAKPYIDVSAALDIVSWVCHCSDCTSWLVMTTLLRRACCLDVLAIYTFNMARWLTTGYNYATSCEIHVFRKWLTSAVTDDGQCRADMYVDAAYVTGQRATTSIITL